MRGYKYRQRLHVLEYGTGMRRERTKMTPENDVAALGVALKVVKGLKEAALDAGMRIHWRKQHSAKK